jgi:hypothetical protein
MKTEFRGSRVTRSERSREKKTPSAEEAILGITIPPTLLGRADENEDLSPFGPKQRLGGVCYSATLGG